MVEMSMTVELGRLPPRSIVAFAARCARRVQALAGLAPLSAEQAASIEHAIGLAEQFAAAKTVSDTAAAQVAAEAAAAAAGSHQAAQCAAKAAYYAVRAADAATTAPYAAAVFAQDAGHAAYAATHAAVGGEHAAEAGYYADYAARADYERLMSLNRGELPRLGQPIDCGPDGPLGAAWPEGPPPWLPGAAH